MPEKKNLSLRLSDELRAAAKRCATADNRTLTSWITNLIAREVTALAAVRPNFEATEPEHPPTPTRRARKPVT